MSAFMGSSPGWETGGSSMLLLGRKERTLRTWAKHSASSAAKNWATPEVALWARAPPICSEVTSSPVTALMTAGPVMCMMPTLSTMKMKSVRAGL